MLPAKLEFFISLAGSISLLLWGSYMLRAAVENAYSDKIGSFICSVAGSRFKSFLCGLASAFALQSATAAVLLTASFITAGLLSLTIAVVVIIGADVGSALVIRVLFLDWPFLAPLLLFTGLCFHRFARTWRHQQLGRILIGLGLMLLSIQLIRQVVSPVASEPISENILALLESASWIALILALLATWVSHSSVAIVLIIASMADVGLLQPPLFVAAVVGANIGSGLIALFLVSRRHIETYSAVLANFIMRLALGILVWALSFLIIRYVNYFGDSGGIQVINIHIAFNLVLAIFFVPLNNLVAGFSKGLLASGQSQDIARALQTPGSSLDPVLISNPALAVSCARREAFRLADNTETLFSQALEMFEVSDRLVIDNFTASDKEINERNKAIQRYLSEVRRHIHKKEAHNSVDEQNLDEILRFSATLENIGDVVSYNLARLAIKRLDRGIGFTPEGHEELTLIHGEVLKLIQIEITNFASEAKMQEKARIKFIDSIIKLGQESINNHRLRLSQRKSKSIGTSSIHQDAVRDLLQVVSYISNIRHS